jgi:cell wall-associated NlpC family hydrolase
VYDSFGIKIPRTAKRQGKAGKRIRLKRSRNGDIIVFKLKSSWHSGIIKRDSDNNLFFIHAPNRLSVVREEV